MPLDVNGEQRTVTAAIAESTATLATAISGIGMAIAVATLIFAGPLHAGLPRATSNFIMGTAIVAGLVGLRSRLIPAVATLQDGPAVVLVALAATVADSSGSDAPLNVLVLIACVTFVTAIAMILIGHFGLAGVVRFLPTTVVGGFIAGTGWLLFKGGFDVMLDSHLGHDDIGSLFQPEIAKYWVPGLALGTMIQLLGSWRRIPPVVLSLLVIAAVTAFYSIVAASSSISSVEDANWLIGPFPSGAGLGLITPSELGAVEWSAIFASPGAALAVIAVALVAVLLNLSGLETLTGTRIDMKHELRTIGIANLLLAPLGAVPGFHALGDTALARKMGARTRVMPLGVAFICLPAAAFGSSLVGFMPRFVAGGLLIAIGLGLLVSWASSMATTVSRSEQLLSALILILIATVGILEGITFGLVAACLIFVVRYSRIDPVRIESTGRETASRVVRQPAEQLVLDANAKQLAIYQLTGYLFFGSFTTVVDRVRMRLESNRGAPDFIVLDFRHVTGIDSSGFELLDRLAAEAAEVDAEILVSNLDAALESRGAGPGRKLFAKLDFALEYAEEELLNRNGDANLLDLADPFAGLSADLRFEFGERSAKAGDVIITQGEPGNSMFLLLSGDLIVTRIDDDGVRHRLRRVGRGTVIGELSVLVDTKRTAEITAETDVEMLVLGSDDYQRLRQERPTLALELQDFVLRELASRTASLSDYLSLALR